MQTRTPAPAAPIVWAWKKYRGRQATAAVESQHAKVVDDALARRLGPVTASPLLPPPAEEAKGVGARSWLFRRRRALAPVAVAPVLVVLWFVVHLAVSWSRVSIALSAIPLLSLAGAGTWWVGQVTVTGPKDAEVRRRKVAAAGVVVLALAWVASPAYLTFPAWPDDTVTVLPDFLAPFGLRWISLAVVTAVAVLARWRRFRPRRVAPAAAIGPVEKWAAQVGCPTGKLPGSYLSGFEQLGESSWAATVVCVPGKHGTAEVRAAISPGIAGIYGASPDRIEVQGQNDYSQPRIIVTKKATLEVSRAWTPGGFDLATGVAEVGTYPDGSRSCLVAYVPGQGIRHMWAFGGTGSGKTSLVSTFLGRVMQHGILVLDLVDLGDTSLPAWVEPSFRFGTTPQAGLMALRRANAVMDARAAAMRTMTQVQRDGRVVSGVSTLTISREWPIYAALIEEWPELLGNSEAVALADRLGRKGRKYGVMIIIVSQGTGLGETFKGADNLRNNIQQGNVGGLRSDKDAGSMGFGGGLKVNMGAIPAGKPGLGFVLSPVNMRDVMSRVDWIDDDPNRPANVPSSWEVAAYAVPGTPNPIDLAAIKRVEDAEAARLSADAAAAEAKAVGQSSAGGQPATVDRASVEAAVKAISAGGAEASTGAVAARLGNKDDTSHYDKVRNLLKQLGEDPSSPVTSPRWGKWAA